MYGVKPLYFFKGLVRSFNIFFRRDVELNKICKSIEISKDEVSNYLLDRVNYYCRLDKNVYLKQDEGVEVKDLRFPVGDSMHKIDLYEYLRFFNPKYRLCVDFADVNYYVPYPTVLKSRPIAFNDDLSLYYKNSIILNLDKYRHFKFVKDKLNFKDKVNRVFFRGAVYQKHRIDFFEKHFDNEICNLGHVGSRETKNNNWNKHFSSIKEHLKYKFILSLEGYDVATNLKWIMSSNSIAVMPKPKYETWFMEGRLEAGVHYIEIADDYSDLNQKVQYYIDNEDEAKKIIKSANEYVEQFKDLEVEKQISIMVLRKYFEYVKFNK